jgi:hypothetical protein
VEGAARLRIAPTPRHHAGHERAGKRRLLEDKFARRRATVAAGPVGRQASASTDVQLSAEILSWSRPKGYLRGCVARAMPPDEDVDEELYGSKIQQGNPGCERPRRLPRRRPITALNRYSWREERIRRSKRVRTENQEGQVGKNPGSDRVGRRKRLPHLVGNYIRYPRRRRRFR